MKTLKRLSNYAAILPLVARGFTVKHAKVWQSRVRKDLLQNKEHNLKNKRWAYSKGYMPDYAEAVGITTDNVDDSVSERDYYYLQPVNGTYRKWLANKVTTRKIFSPYAGYLPKHYYSLRFSERNGLQINPLEDCPVKGNQPEDIIELLKTEKILTVTESKKSRCMLLEYRDGKMYAGEDLCGSAEAFLEKLEAFSKSSLIQDYAEPVAEMANECNPYGDILRIVVFHKTGDAPVICEADLNVGMHFAADEEGNVIRYDGITAQVDLESGKYSGGQLIADGVMKTVETDDISGKKIEGTIPGWDDLKKLVHRMCNFAPQLEFFGMDVSITEKGFRFVRFLNTPRYPKTHRLGEQTVEFLKYKLAEKKKFYTFSKRAARGAKKIKLKVRRQFAKAFFPAGLKPYLSVRWIKEVCTDLFTNKDTSLGTKIWAYRHGFLSYRIPQYGITKENHKQFISDFEYKWLRHINGKYRVWFEDKITFQYILPQYKQYFPDYYYYINNENGRTAIVPMMDCHDPDARDFKDIFELVKEKGVLAMKPDEGSHGDGFYKFSYENGKYCLNDKEADENQVMAILTNPDNQYLITEYIKNNEQFKKIYAGAVNTIRMIVFKKDGVTPEIGNVYMRFGSKQTGAVDNMGAGGMFVQVDSETGWYGNAKIITQNSIQDCPHHPDTGVLIEGTIPHYEKIKSIILDMAANITDLEYFGFDVAVTEDSIKLPEINRFPDYPKIEKLSPQTIDYLLLKLEQKKHRYGYDVKPCRKLVHLPKR